MERVGRLLILSLIMSLDLEAQQIAPLDICEGATQVALVVDEETGDVVYEYDKHRRVTPASLTKLFTTAAVLSNKKGSDKFQTEVYYDKQTSTITVVGGGDPTIESRYLQNNAIEKLSEVIVKAVGQNETIGMLAIDESYLIGAKMNSKRLWEDMGNYYGAAWTPINIADNTYTITLSSPKEAGRQTKIESVELDVAEEISNYVISYSRKGDSAYVYGVDSEHVYISGAIPSGRERFAIKAALNNPSKYFAEKLSKRLNDKGVKVEKISFSSDGTMRKGQRIAGVDSPSLQKIAEQTNQRSINLYADALLMKFGEHDGFTSWDKSVGAVNAFVGRVTAEKSSLYDGSGLSPMNKITASQVVSVLKYMIDGPFADEYRKTLSEAGTNGTLRRFGKGTILEKRLIGKSGTMLGVKGYAGYVKNEKNKELVFCIIVNNHTETASELDNKIVSWLVELMKK